MRLMKWLAITLSVLMLLGGIGYLNREALMLGAIKLYFENNREIGPTQPVLWQSGPDPEGRAPAERPPNIILIVADDLGWNDLTFNGGGVAGGTVPTLHIDAIAREGAIFWNGYAANGTCAPSRAALMSGRYGTRFGFEFTPTPPGMMPMLRMLSDPNPRLRRSVPNRGAETLPFEDMGMPASEITLAEVLADAGYHTAHIGKWHLGRANGMAPHDQGFKESLLMESGLYLPEDHPDVVNSKQDFDRIDRFLWAAMAYAASFNGGAAFEPETYLTDYYTDNAVEVIKANKDRPFFLYLAHWAPHTPLQAKREDYDALDHIELHRERVYAAMIRALDRGVGAVMAALEEHGIDDNTLVLFTSDNGGAGYIGLPDVNAPYRGWKITLFEGGIHVPFFARWPARIPAGTEFDAPVHHFDFFATAAGAAGAALPTDRVMDGVDLVPFLTGEAEGVPHRELFWRSGASQSALVDGWKLNVSDPPGRTWLFDLASDPNEQIDLSSQRQDRLETMLAALATHNAAQQDPAWPSQAASPINIDKDLSVADAENDEYIYWSN
ncbi:MAG: sulfatase-like hydrolase/transferase [Pseudomonadota bacterium]